MPFGQAPGQGFNEPINPRVVSQVIQVKGAYLYYSPSPGLGNLIASTAPSIGTDKFGNQWLNGITTYQQVGGNSLAIQMDGNQFNLNESTAGPGGPYSIIGQLFGSISGGMVLSAFNSLLAFNSAGQVFLESSSNHISFAPPSGKNVIAQQPILAGSIGLPETWHPFTLAGGTSSGNDINGTSYPPEYALDAQGNLKIAGVLVAGAGGLASGATWATVPSGYTPTTNIPVSLVSVAGHGTLVHVYVRPNGNMQFNAALGAGAVVYLNTTLFLQGT